MAVVPLMLPPKKIAVTNHALDRYSERVGEPILPDMLERLIRENWTKARSATEGEGYEIPLQKDVFASVRPDKAKNRENCWIVTTIIADTLTTLISDRLGLNKKTVEALREGKQTSVEVEGAPVSAELEGLTPAELEGEITRIRKEIERRRAQPEYMEMQLKIWPKVNGKGYLLSWTYNGKPAVEVDITKRELNAFKALIGATA